MMHNKVTADIQLIINNEAESLNYRAWSDLDFEFVNIHSQR